MFRKFFFLFMSLRKGCLFKEYPLVMNRKCKNGRQTTQGLFDLFKSDRLNLILSGKTYIIAPELVIIWGEHCRFISDVDCSGLIKSSGSVN